MIMGLRLMLINGGIFGNLSRCFGQGWPMIKHWSSKKELGLFLERYAPGSLGTCTQELSLVLGPIFSNV